jgi:hypothetical protein
LHSRAKKKKRAPIKVTSLSSNSSSGGFVYIADEEKNGSRFFPLTAAIGDRFFGAKSRPAATFFGANFTSATFFGAKSRRAATVSFVKCERTLF